MERKILDVNIRQDEGLFHVFPANTDSDLSICLFPANTDSDLSVHPSTYPSICIYLHQCPCKKLSILEVEMTVYINTQVISENCFLNNSSLLS